VKYTALCVQFNVIIFRRTAFLLGGEIFIWKHVRALVIMNEPKSTAPSLTLHADDVDQGDIPLRLCHFGLY
jgi:hypothetical protein